ncbi:MAG: ABC transporter substrate-binding protein [Acetobacteraceae bacterium]|nr:ABC transporter substrate-binding protein [Acetobacteraceae bacterium]
MFRRTLLTTAGAALAAPALLRSAWAADMPGVTKDEIKIGNTDAYSGPASAYGAIGRGHVAFFKRLNDQGGIGGRKINFITYDDGYSPPKTVEQTRRLVEQDGVAFTFNALGTPTQSAVHRYMNQKKVPQVFVSSGADKWSQTKEFPWTIGWQPSYRTEGQIYAKYILANKPDGKIAVLFQNDDFGKDYLIGLKDGLGDKFDKMVINQSSYEVTDPTIDSQAVAMKSSGADVLVSAATPKFAAQIIRKIYELDWKPLHLLTDVSISVNAVINPAGPERATGLIAASYYKDNSDPQWKDDPGMNEWRDFMKQYLPDAELSDSNYVFAYGVATTCVQMLKQCGADLSRENIMAQAKNLERHQPPTLIPGCYVSTGPTNAHPIRHMQLQRWNGKRWELFGDVIEGAGA